MSMYTSVYLHYLKNIWYFWEMQEIFQIFIDQVCQGRGRSLGFGPEIALRPGLRERRQHGHCHVAMCRGHLSSMATGTAAPILLATGNPKGRRHSTRGLWDLWLGSCNLLISFIHSFIHHAFSHLFHWFYSFQHISTHFGLFFLNATLRAGGVDGPDTSTFPTKAISLERFCWKLWSNYHFKISHFCFFNFYAYTYMYYFPYLKWVFCETFQDIIAKEKVE